MEPRTLEYFADACAGELRHGPPGTLAQRICTDSRLAQAGDLFIALEGDRFDGHAFLAEVLQKRVAGLVVRREKVPPVRGRFGMLVVEDTRKALGRMAARYRRDFQIPMIAVGGSNGKTSTKELIASVLSEKIRVLRSEASFNNDIGVPLTLLGLQQDYDAAVLEVGSNHPGELAPLLNMIQPRLGVITNIGREHLEFFGDVQGVAQEEGWLAESLPTNGTLVVNGDQPIIEKVAARTRAAIVRAGFGSNNDWRASELRPDRAGTTFRVASPAAAWDGEYRVNLLGRHQVANALLALAVGAHLGLSRDQLAAGLAKAQPAKLRMQIRSLRGLTILDDCYNANADSVEAALNTLRDFPGTGRRIAVLGDMAELGSHTISSHQEIGRQAAASGVDYLITIGENAQATAASAVHAGLHAVDFFGSVEEAAQRLETWTRPGDVVLVKASRMMRLEQISEWLAETRGAKV